MQQRGARCSPLTLPAGSGIKSAQPRTRRQHDSCFRMTMGKHTESLPVLASFGRRWSVAKILFFSTVDKGQQQGGDCEGTVFKWQGQFFSCKWILTFSTVWDEPWCFIVILLQRHSSVKVSSEWTLNFFFFCDILCFWKAAFELWTGL